MPVTGLPRRARPLASPLKDSSVPRSALFSSMCAIQTELAHAVNVVGVHNAGRLAAVQHDASVQHDGYDDPVSPPPFFCSMASRTAPVLASSRPLSFPPMKRYGGITPYGEGRAALARTPDSKSINSIMSTAAEAAVPLWCATTLSTSSRRPSVGQPSLSTSASWARTTCRGRRSCPGHAFPRAARTTAFPLCCSRLPPPQKTCACGSMMRLPQGCQHFCHAVRHVFNYVA